jgi:branched-chain amino acid transport system ATP-binding protein
VSPAPAIADPALVIDGVTVNFGGVKALDDLSFTAERGQIVGIVGPNGAGKSTLLNAIGGLVRVSSGTIEYRGTSLLDRSPSARAGLGIARTFQDSRLIPGMTVLEQILCGVQVSEHANAEGATRRFSNSRYSWLDAAVRTPHFVRRERAMNDHTRELLRQVGLESLATTSVDALPGPYRRLVDLTRALSVEPSLLMLDEVCAGLSQPERERVAEVVAAYRTAIDPSVTVLLIEHDLAFVRAMSDRVVVIVEGNRLADGLTDDVLDQADVLAAYVGESAEASEELS